MFLHLCKTAANDRVREIQTLTGFAFVPSDINEIRHRFEQFPPVSIEKILITVDAAAAVFFVCFQSSGVIKRLHDR